MKNGLSLSQFTFIKFSQLLLYIIYNKPTQGQCTRVQKYTSRSEGPDKCYTTCGRCHRLSKQHHNGPHEYSGQQAPYLHHRKQDWPFT